MGFQKEQKLQNLLFLLAGFVGNHAIFVFSIKLVCPFTIISLIQRLQWSLFNKWPLTVLL